MDFPRLIGVIGLLVISAGVLQRSAKVRNILFAVGAVFLFAYSVSIEDTIFAILQLVFAGTAMYDLNRKREDIVQ